MVPVRLFAHIALTWGRCSRSTLTRKPPCGVIHFAPFALSTIISSATKIQWG
jgi:hypothetical protein